MRTIFGHPQWGTIVCDDADRSVWLKVPFGQSIDEIDVYIHESDQLPTIDDVASLELVASYLIAAQEKEPEIRRRVVAQVLDRFVHPYGYGYDEHQRLRPEFNATRLMASIQLSFIVLEREGPHWWGFRSDALLDRQMLMTSVSVDFETIGDVSLYPP